jgi:ABC-2 type transport system ATP-binding protein
MPTIEPAIDARGLVKRFKALTAVDHVDLRLEPGRALALLGPNGAGKTTLVEMLEGLQSPDEGSIRLFGLAWGPDTHRLRGLLGVCLQETRLPEKLSVRELLRLFASFHGLDRRRADTVMGSVGLDSKADAWSEKLSGGQRQRLALGVAMLAQPRLLLLDEPTTGLDPAARHEVWGLIETLQRQGCSLLLTTHYMEEAEALCPEVALMNRGKLLARGRVGALLRRHAGGDRIDLRLRKPAPAGLLRLPGLLRAEPSDGRRRLSLQVRSLAPALHALTREASRRRLDVVELSTHKATLEDLFLRLAGGRLREDAGEDD